MKKIIRLTESDLHRIIRNSVRRIIKEDYNQFSDGDFASEDPYAVGTDDVDPISDVREVNPKMLRNVYIWDTGDSYYEFEANYGWYDFRGTYSNEGLEVYDVIIGNGGHGHQMNPNDVNTTQFKQWFDNTLGQQIITILDSKIKRGDFEME